MHKDWRKALEHDMAAPYFYSVNAFVSEERARNMVFPSDEDLFRCLTFTSPRETKVVILGQDPYHGAAQAHGLSFSVPAGTPFPPSLRNIFKELSDDCAIPAPVNGDLSRWAQQGVLLLNTTLTVRNGQAGSHIGHGWEQFTDQIIRVVNENTLRCVFILWGEHARKKRALITGQHHVVIEGVHPSPLSSYRGFFGSKPFTKANQALAEAGRSPIDWTL